MYKKCLQCGRGYIATRSDQMYCSTYCRQQSYRTYSELIFPIKKQWFDMIASGEKKEEYREIKPYWTKRLDRVFTRFYNTNEIPDDDGHIPEYLWSQERQVVKYRNGYSSNAPEIECEVSLREGYGKEEWGAVPGVKYYVFTIHRILK